MIDNLNYTTKGSENVQYNANKVNYNNDYMQGIEPYLESLKFFTKLTEISNKFKRNYMKNNKNPNLPSEFKSIDDFIEYFKNHNILLNEKEGDNFKEKDKISFEENPHIILDFLLNQLHKIFKINSNEEDYNPRIKAAEYDQNKAHISFKEFIQNDKSLISDLFFGEKLIQKYCKNCQLEQYIYKYLKFIKLDLKSIESNINIELEELLEEKQKKSEENYFCSMCSSNQNSRIKITINEYPKILIIIIINPHDPVRITFPQKIFKEKYELIAAEVNIIENISSNVFIEILQCFRDIFSFRKDKKKYNLFFKKDINILNLDNENKEKVLNDTVHKCYKPYVLFYRKMKEKKERNHLSEEYDLSENNMIVDENNKNTDIGNSLKNSINKGNINSFENNRKNNIKKKNEIAMDNISNISNNNFYDDSSKNKVITLYFYFIDNEKELYIDVNENEKLENIIENLIKNYKLSQNFLYEYHFSFNNMEIDFQKSPKQLGIISESKIFVKLIQ